MTDDEIKAAVADAEAYLLAHPDLLDSHARTFARVLVALADRKLRVPDDEEMTKVITEAISPGWDRDDRAEFVRDAINAELARRRL